MIDVIYVDCILSIFLSIKAVVQCNLLNKKSGNSIYNFTEILFLSLTNYIK